MWEQYRGIKKDALDSLLFYRMGDFYELFLDDAIDASNILGITLTARNRGEEFPVPMCGVPFHSATNYINRLLQAGKRVAICEQTSEPTAGKGIVKREIVRVVSPGIAYDQDSLAAGATNYLLTLALSELGGSYCALDLSTGHFSFGSFKNADELRDELAILSPKEILAPQSQIGSEAWNELVSTVGKEYFQCITPTPDFYFVAEYAFDSLCQHFQILNLDAFDLQKESSELGAIGAALRSARDTQKMGDLRHLQAPVRRENKSFLLLDESTIEHLDLFPKANQAPQDSLFFHIDRTLTAMGARKLREVLARPLANEQGILERQDAVAELLENYALLQRLKTALQGTRDLERLIGKIGLKSAGPRDLVALLDVFVRLPQLKESLSSLGSSSLLKKIESKIEAFSALRAYLELRLREEPPAVSREGNIFKSGWHKELDELINLTEDGKSFITAMEQREREATGINSLKIKYNRVFGYFIEITSSNLSAVPAHYIRKQTTANGERFLTPELKSFEDKILSAEEKRIALEESLFAETLDVIGKESLRILATAQELALLDVLQSFATAAAEYGYSRPEISTDLVLEIEEGRHPALENLVGRDRFIPNDVQFDGKNKLFLITGPNMAGKSTFMRQVALLTLLAHTGSFVPAKRAKIGLTDRIATRVGASDRIGRGQSTFMVEMNEMARILRQASERSLLIIDEIGRGTSTFDGLALAWSIVEDLQARLGCRTLFATHYHELTVLADELSGLQNLTVSVEERGNQILFLHKVVNGKASGSYGVQVAQLAGLPADTVSRAKEILADLAKAGSKLQKNQKISAGKTQQMSLFSAAPAPKIPEHLLHLEKEIRDLNLDHCTPWTAMLTLKNLKEKMTNLH